VKPLGRSAQTPLVPRFAITVGAVVVILTGRGESSRRMEWPAAGLATALTVVERNLAAEDAAAALAAVTAGRAPYPVLALIPLMQGGGDPVIVAAWLALAAAEPDARRRADAGGLALVFAEAAGRRDPWTKALEGWNVVQSQQVLEWQALARREGRDEGIKQGIATGQQDSLLTILSLRYQALPQEVVDSIRKVTDRNRLDGLVAAALQEDTLEKFRRATGL
jgi:hypothetical protein